MRKKKILFLITKATYGGAQKYVYDIISHLPNDLFEPIFAFGQNGKLSSDVAGLGITVKEIPSLGRDIAFFSDIASFFEIWKTIQQVKPDIIHLNSSKAAVLGALAARFAGVKKIIVTVHGWPFKENRGVFSRAIIYFASWLTAALSHAVIVVSNEDTRIGKRMWFVREKINYLPLALNVTEMFPRESAEKVVFIPGNRFSTAIRLVSIAELTPNKGIRHGIEMMKALESRTPGKYTYSIFGQGEEQTSLVKLAEGLPPDSINFANVNPPINTAPANLSSEASKFLRAFDIFILPSIKEGMPYVLLEAAAAGLPIVASNVVKDEASSFPNIYFVPPGDAYALADAVEKLAQNTPAKTPSTIGSFTNMLKKTVSLYRS